MGFIPVGVAYRSGRWYVMVEVARVNGLVILSELSPSFESLNDARVYAQSLVRARHP